MENKVIFSVKYMNPEYPDENWAADWKLRNKDGWSISSSPNDKICWAHERMGLNQLARSAILKKFGLTKWALGYLLERIEKMSPADLAKERRAKEQLYGLPRLDIISDNMHIDFTLEKRRVSHPAEDYN